MYRNLPIYFAPEGVDTGTATGGAVTPPAVDTWYGKAGVAADHHEFIKGKEFSDVNTMMSSYRSLESMVGRNRLAVPTGADDREAHDAIFRTLGRPDKAEYKLPETVKFQEETWKVFQPVAHGLGLSQSQVEGISKWYFETGTAAIAAKEVERNNREAAETVALEKEWGSAMAGNKDLASRAFRNLGFDQATVDKIEDAIGYQATMKMFHKIGSGLKEDAFHQDATRTSTAETEDTVQGKINTLLADKEFKDRYNNHDPRVRAGAIKEMEALQIKLADIRQKAGVA